MELTVEKICGFIVNAIGHKDADISSGCLVRPVYQISVSNELTQEMLEDE